MACFKNCCSGDCSVDKDKLIAGGIIAAGAVFSMIGLSKYMKAAKLKKKIEEPVDDDAEFEKYLEKKQKKRAKKIRKNIISGICFTAMSAIATTIGILYLTPVKDKVMESNAVVRLKEIELPKVDVSKIREIEIPKVDVSKISIPKVNLSKLETISAIKKLESTIESLKKNI